MLEFPNLHSVTNLSRTGATRQYPVDKRDGAGAATGQAIAADVVQISADAALKSKLGAFAATLAREVGAVSAERMALLKEQYAGDRCPVSGAEVAAAMVTRAGATGHPHA